MTSEKKSAQRHKTPSGTVGVLQTTDLHGFWMAGVSPLVVDQHQKVSRVEVSGKPNGQSFSYVSSASARSPIVGNAANANAVPRPRGRPPRNKSNQVCPLPITKPSCVSVSVVDDTVMCSVVPLLPRTHAEYGLVSQIVPFTLWPPLPPQSCSTVSSGRNPMTLQQSVGLASEIHHSYLLASDTPPSFSTHDDTLQGAIVEWASGNVGHTSDTEGLWKEQRIVSEQYYGIFPLQSHLDCRNCKREEDGESIVGGVNKKVWHIAPEKPPSTLRGAVVEQLRRFRFSNRYNTVGHETAASGQRHGSRVRINKNQLKDVGWILLFSRVVEVTGECSTMLEKVVSRWGKDAADDTAVLCDTLLDEIILVGLKPRGEPHRLSLVCPSVARRLLLTSSGYAVKQEEEEYSSVYYHYLQRTIDCKLFDSIIKAVRESLCRRIAVQYELLRLLRMKALLLSHHELIGQYTYWYSAVPSPSCVMHVLAGCTVFRELTSLRWSRGSLDRRNGTTRSPAPSLVTSEVGSKRMRGEGTEVEVMVNTSKAPTNQRADDGVDKCSNGTVTPLVKVPFEMDLLEDDYLTRFAAKFRRHGNQQHNSGNTANFNSNGSTSGGCVADSNDTNYTSGHSSVNSAGNNFCDETAMAATLSWLRRRRCTMTLREIDAFRRKKYR